MNELERAIHAQPRGRLRSDIGAHVRRLNALLSGHSRRDKIYDLIANALRRATAGRYDDAVARMYRAVDAWVRWQLESAHGVPEEGLMLEHLRPDLRDKWNSRASDQGELRLGVSEAFALLTDYDKTLGAKYEDIRETLSARNKSILAHGYQPISEKTCEAFRKKLFDLIDIDESALPKFPQIHVSPTAPDSE